MGTTYSLAELADLAGVTPRTIRYYIVSGLLPSPGRAGPGTTYADGHLDRLRLIRRLQREHLPLAAIRSRLASLDDATVAALVEAPDGEQAPGSALDYVRGVLEGDGSPGPPFRNPASEVGPRGRQLVPPGSPVHVSPARMTPASQMSPGPLRAAGYRLAESSQLDSDSPIPDRSQWDRVLLSPDVEIHVRRPLDRRQHKRVERLIEIARELLKEDQP